MYSCQRIFYVLIEETIQYMKIAEQKGAMKNIKLNFEPLYQRIQNIKLACLMHNRLQFMLYEF